MSKFLRIKPDLKLSELNNIVGTKNVDSILSANSLQRCANIGAQLLTKQNDVKLNSKPVTWQEKVSTLNANISSSDVFEELALMSSADWKVVRNCGTIPGTLAIPEAVHVPDSADIIGNDQPVPRDIYTKTIQSIEHSEDHIADPAIFNEYNYDVINTVYKSEPKGNADPFQWFNLPWGDISLHSSLSDEMVDFPVYPEELQNKRNANYGTMPDILFQYEPWQVYESSGPRQESYTFKGHRDMWTGDHRDGLANKLIRFCEANCYPEYTGSAVNTSIVTLFVKGKKVIRGVMTECTTNWSGPIGLDGWYLQFELTISITEVSETPLSYTTVRNKGLIE